MERTDYPVEETERRDRLGGSADYKRSSVRIKISEGGGHIQVSLQRIIPLMVAAV